MTEATLTDLYRLHLAAFELFRWSLDFSVFAFGYWQVAYRA